MSLSSLASGLSDLVSGAAPSDVYDFPFPLRFISAVRSMVRSYHDRRDLFSKEPVSEATGALAPEILETVRKYCDDVETLFKLDKSSDVVKLNRDAAVSGSRVSVAYRNFSSVFCDDLTALWRRGWDEIESLGIGHVFNKTSDPAVVVEIGVLAYDMAVILLLLNAFTAFFSDAVRSEFDRFHQGGVDVAVACLVVARRCLPDFTAMPDALFKVFKGSGKTLAKFDLQSAVSTLGFTVVVNQEDAEEAEELERAKMKRDEEIFFVPVNRTHSYDRPYLLLKIHPKGRGIPVGYVPIGPPLFEEDNGHVQAFTNRMVDLFPMVVGTMLPPAAPTLAEVAGPGVLRELGKA